MNLELIHEALRELSDANYQAALWSGQVAGEQSSFTEAICVLFNDAGLERALDSGTLEKTYSQDLCLQARQLSSLVTLIDDTGTPAQTLNHPKMNAVRGAAQALSKLFMAEAQRPTPDSPRSTPRG
jgi:hypothetical protein